MCKGRSDFFKRNSVVLYVVIALLVIVVLYLSCSKTNCVSENLIIAFIAAVASMVVIGNFSQVSRIQDETERKMNCIKEDMKVEFGKFSIDMNARMKANDLKIKELEERIMEIDELSVKDDIKIALKKENEGIKAFIEKEGLEGFVIKGQYTTANCIDTRYHFAIRNNKEAWVFKVANGCFKDRGIRALDENGFVDDFKEEENREFARNIIEGWKKLYNLN